MDAAATMLGADSWRLMCRAFAIVLAQIVHCDRPAERRGGVNGAPLRTVRDGRDFFKRP